MSVSTSTEAYGMAAADPNRVSLSVIPVELWTKDKLGDDVCLGVGTAFCDTMHGRQYLVTNWHNVTGRHPKNGQPIADDGVIPSFLRAHFLKFLTMPDGQAAWSPRATLSTDLPIETGFLSDWIMHQDGQAVDLAAFPLQDDSTRHATFMNECVAVSEPYLEVGTDVFILGYPQGLRPTGNLPIWKRGSIATEPMFAANRERCFWVDSATRKGMSGSPVVARVISKEDELKQRGPLSPDTPIIFRHGLSFVGVYSGRVGVSDALEAQLGKIWHATLVQEMLLNPRPLDFEV